MLKLLGLVVAWLLWSGHYTVALVPDADGRLHLEGHGLIAAFGALSCLGVALLARRMRASEGGVPKPTLTARVVLYIPWLLWEIVKSNLHVARVILDPKLPISPRLVRVKASQRGEGAQVLYANSITLTPGTISLDLRDGWITVHALTKETAEGLETGEMDRRVSGLERKP